MDTALIDELEQLVAALGQAQMAEDYEQALKLQSRIADLCRKLEAVPPGSLKAYEERLQSIYSKLAEGLSLAEQAHHEVKEELLGYKKKAAGISAYRQNAGRIRRW